MGCGCAQTKKGIVRPRARPRTREPPQAFRFWTNVRRRDAAPGPDAPENGGAEGVAREPTTSRSPRCRRTSPAPALPEVLEQVDLADAADRCVSGLGPLARTAWTRPSPYVKATRAAAAARRRPSSVQLASSASAAARSGRPARPATSNCSWASVTGCSRESRPSHRAALRGKRSSPTTSSTSARASSRSTCSSSVAAAPRDMRVAGRDRTLQSRVRRTLRCHWPTTNACSHYSAASNRRS